MADTYRIMYDGVNTLAAGIQKDFPHATMVAGYVNGDYAWTAKEWDLFPRAVHVLISITAFANIGDVLDVENGDAEPGQTEEWIRARKAAGYARPTLYCNLSTVPAIRAGTGPYLLGKDYDLWIADWTGTPHEVSIPAADGGPAGEASAVQYRSTSAYDVSCVWDEGWPHR